MTPYQFKMFRLMGLAVILQQHFLKILNIVVNIFLWIYVNNACRIEKKLKLHFFGFLYIKSLLCSTCSLSLPFIKLYFIIQNIRFRVDHSGKGIAYLVAIRIVRIVIR